MCGIAGFCKIGSNFLNEKEKWEEILRNMNKVQKHRGPDDDGIYISENCCFSHVRLSIIDLKNAKQPMKAKYKEKKGVIVYNGEIYNANELREELKKKGAKFKTRSDTEVILMGHLVYGEKFVKRLNGIFSYVIWDEVNKELTLFRDRLGVKPLFYLMQDEVLIFASEIKALFKYPNVKRAIDSEGLCEIFGLGPAKTFGKGVFKDVFELLPGNFIKIKKNSIKQIEYWKLKSKNHVDSFEETVEKTSFLVCDAIKKQTVSDVPICTFLSGGLDSSLVSAICSLKLKKMGYELTTFSFDYCDSEKYFKSNDFQPFLDRPWVDIMVNSLKTNHTYLECDFLELLDNLFKAVDARDLPCMADVESSLLYFCSKVSKKNKVVLTGECADEIFGGYPWFYKENMFNAKTFPWSLNLSSRKIILSDYFLNSVDIDSYVQNAYEKTVSQTPKLFGENEEEGRRREIYFLNIKWFMQNLLDRMDRTSMYNGLEARVPFADHRIVEYLFNVPWEMKFCGNVAKGLLKKVAKNHIPKEVILRKKNPYPKTYDPNYEKALKNMMLEVISNNNSPILNFLDKKKVKKFLNSPSNYCMPWFGQLMAGPQMIAYMMQINYWFLKYKVEIL